MRLFSVIGFVFVLVLIGWWHQEPTYPAVDDKYFGVSLESPPKSIDSLRYSTVAKLNPSHVAIIPYAFSRSGEPMVYYDRNLRWWGESFEGVVTLVNLARAQRQSIMIKPHVWISKEGWPGEYTLKTEEDWQVWEETYTRYIIDFATLADSLEVELFCIGTEFRKAVVERPEFWQQLIREVKAVYTGKITYAANWDNFENVSFWKELDYIGIDAYFPLDTALRPSREHLIAQWQPINQLLAAYSKKYQKPILFTEYGYRSVCHTTGPHWESDDHLFDEKAQQVAYEAMYETVWSQPWFAGGFLWKWRFYDDIGGFNDKGFTPQGKSAETTIARYYRIGE